MPVFLVCISNFSYSKTLLHLIHLVIRIEPYLITFIVFYLIMRNSVNAIVNVFNFSSVFVICHTNIVTRIKHAFFKSVVHIHVL